MEPGTEAERRQNACRPCPDFRLVLNENAVILEVDFLQTKRNQKVRFFFLRRGGEGRGHETL